MPRPRSSTDSPRDPPSKPRKSDMAHPHMQAVYKEQLKKHAMKLKGHPIYSRYGCETKYYHNEFMKVHSEVKQSKLDESQRVQPKVNTNRTFAQGK